ncbi:MAG TPA: ATP-binding cassette domain-containing protein [Candidatus Limnocylindrales bacterium]|nr:ATP-binding cassette domain-containing protein [Candidatus Limnocylindrales bacterium]
MSAAPETPPRVRAGGFGWTYRDRARPVLDGLSFEVEPGQVLLVLGPSGSGKSTLARALAGIVPHALGGTWRGHLSVGELEVPATPPAVLGERVGIVFQDPDSQMVMPGVADEVAFGLENRGWPRAEMLSRVPEALAAVGLAGFEERATATLSGGERQRLALAGVLAPAPGLLVLDEPTANLDPVGMEAIFGHLARLAEGRRHTIVVIEHRLERVWPLADLVLVLDGQGRQTWFGVPAEEAARKALLALDGSRGGSDAAVLAADAAADHAMLAAAAAPGRDVLIAAGVAVDYPDERGGRRLALAGLDLRLRAGERIGLVGPNGSGKSSLLGALAGLIRPAAGTVLIVGSSGASASASAPGLDPARLGSARLPALLGLAFQDPEIGFVGRTVWAEVAAGPAADRPDEAAIRAALERFGLRGLDEASPFQLSQGEQRRLSLAALAVRRPQLLLLDEPTFGLDRANAEAVLDLLDEGRAEGQAQLLATHDPRLLPRCDRVLALDGGRCVFDGPPQAFLARPPYVPPDPWRLIGSDTGPAQVVLGTTGLAAAEPAFAER